MVEATGLTEAIGLAVVRAELVPLRRRRPSTLLGKGWVETVEKGLAEPGTDAELIVVDGALTPIQQRNLERAWKRKVIDRTGLILEIFGERARTREGVLQVELAALRYQRSRLVRSWTHLERQRGGFGFLGGPGESQIEIDRRRIDERILRIESDLARVVRTRGLHRSARGKVPYPVVALVGYTNAGKSTLFNRLTGAAVEARDMLFATLDPTMRDLRLPSGQRVILSDTVGFISDLPTGLVAAFRATLEEVRAADLILHVRDIAHEESEAQRLDVLRVLDELGQGDRAAEGRIVELWNKADLLPEEARAARAAEALRRDDVVLASALTGEGLDALLARIDRGIVHRGHLVEVRLAAEDGGTLAWLYREGDVLERRESGDGLAIRVALADDALGRLRARLGPEAVAELPQAAEAGKLTAHP
jgi:GTPase